MHQGLNVSIYALQSLCGLRSVSYVDQIKKQNTIVKHLCLISVTYHLQSQIRYIYMILNIEVGCISLRRKWEFNELPWIKPFIYNYIHRALQISYAAYM